VRLWPWRTHAEKVEQVLAYLARHGETSGTELGDACRLGKGTRYVLFYRLEEEGLISSRINPEDTLFHRRLYRITGDGRKKLAKDTQLHQAALAWGL
jgi:DNA-binding MarR family transcriptional regulator